MKITVLQWNAWYKEDARHIAQFLSEQKADITCLQELTIDYPDQAIQHGPNYIAEQLGYHYFNKEIAFEGRPAKQANAILSRYPIVRTRHVWINEPTGTGKYDDEYRVLIEVTLDIEGTEVVVATTHMSYTHGFEMTERKMAETDALLAAIPTDAENYILAGDFNAQPGSYTMQQIEKRLRNASPAYSVPTWTTKPFSYDGFEANELNWRLDYIFASQNLKVIDTTVIKTDYSDHLPILTTFELQ